MKFGRVLPISLFLILSSELSVAQLRIEPSHNSQTSERADVMLLELNIPAQPLESALKAFADAAHVAVFYESVVVAGRRSFPVSGKVTVEIALRLMLQGTGLSSTSFDRGTITILASERKDAASEVRLAKAGVAEFSHYLALVQKSLDFAFCRAPVVATDPDELLARLWLSPSGEVLHADLLSSTGSDQRDRIYTTTLGALVIGARPPAVMPQPVNLMIMPRRSRGSVACMKLGAEAKRATHE